jgi:hypothetical protein
MLQFKHVFIILLSSRVLGIYTKELKTMSTQILHTNVYSNLIPRLGSRQDVLEAVSKLWYIRMMEDFIVKKK